MTIDDLIKNVINHEGENCLPLYFVRLDIVKKQFSPAAVLIEREEIKNHSRLNLASANIIILP